jgi:hypothetical protein
MGGFVVRLDGAETLSKPAAGRYPAPEELKELLAARVAPAGHFAPQR